MQTIMSISDKPKRKPERRTGEQQIDRRLLQMMPADLDARGRARVAPWTKHKNLDENRKLPRPISDKTIVRIEATATEEIRVNDVLTLIGITGVLQDAEKMGLTQTSTHKEAGGTTFALISVVLSGSQFCRAAAGDHNIQSFVASLKRLQSYNVTYYDAHGGSGSAKYLYDYKHDVPSGEISVLMKSCVIDYYRKSGWIIDIADIRKIRNSASQALALHMSQQPGNRFDMDKLAKRIGINCTSAKENRRKLKEAFGALIPKENDDPDFIRSYETEGDYIVFERGSLLRKVAKLETEIEMKIETDTDTAQ